MEIDRKLHEEIKAYCKYNGLKIGEYINSLLRKAFNEDRFGTMPFPLMKNAPELAEPEIYPYQEEKPEKPPVPEVEKPEEKEEIKEVKPKKTTRRLK